MHILFIASEADPFAKTGGLADVASSLPKALEALGHDVRLVLPLYRTVDRRRFGLRKSRDTVSVAAGSRTLVGAVWSGTLPRARVPVFFIEQPALFDREGLYQERGSDYPDNLERFSFFSQAALQLAGALKPPPDLIHCHDWQTALACAHLAFGGAGQGSRSAPWRSVFTVHNLAYQGLFPRAQWPLTGLPDAAFSAQHGLEFYGQLCCLKGGLVASDAVTTVSETYAKEIQTKEFGCGLEGVLKARSGDLTGIVNGIDTQTWNPEEDPHLAAPYAVYSSGSVAGKSVCKRALQQQLGLRQRPEPRQQPELLIGMIQRLAEQKGIDIFLEALDRLMTLPAQLAILGTGEPKYHERLQAAAKRFPGRLSVTLAFDEPLAHRIEAGADAFLMPSRFEPCGLNQMYSMRYGTVPIVHRVGGLADTVVDVAPKTLSARTARGFVFDGYSASALLEAVRRAVAAFEDKPLWAKLVRNGMRQDFSWDHSAREYVKVYQRALAKQ